MIIKNNLGESLVSDEIGMPWTLTTIVKRCTLATEKFIEFVGFKIRHNLSIS